MWNDQINLIKSNNYLKIRREHGVDKYEGTRAKYHYINLEAGKARAVLRRFIPGEKISNYALTGYLKIERDINFSIVVFEFSQCGGND